MRINVVTVVGANGTMGCNVSGIFASFGNAKVYMVSRSIEKSKLAIQRAVKSVRAGSIEKNLIPADYDMLPECVRESDLVFESVAEDLEVKKEITRNIAEYAKDEAIISTGTSGLSITTLAQIFPAHLRSRYFGIHMFNPPYNLNLCEVTPTQYTDRTLFEDCKQYLSQTLFRTVVEVKDSPAFLGNRVGFQFINRALQFAEKYQYSGGIDYVDSILGPHSGRSMAPIVTSDFVGLDVHKAIVDNIFHNAPDYAQETFVLPAYAQKLIDNGKLGRKTRGGLYKLEVFDDGSKHMKVYDIVSDTYRDKITYVFPFAELMKNAIYTGNYHQALTVLVENRSIEAEICLEFMLQYIIYALFAANSVGYDIHAADDVMATGFNWCPPMAMAEAIGSVADLESLMKERLDPSILEQMDIHDLLGKRQPSRYDYRIYFRSGLGGSR